MSLDAILDAIRQSGASSVRAIEERSQEEVGQILSEAAREAESIQQEARVSACKSLAADRARMIHQARQEALHLVGDAQQQIVEQALEHVKTRLASLRSAPEYPEIFKSLLEEALGEIRGSLLENEAVLLHADPRDRALLDSLVRDMGGDLRVGYDLESFGGVRMTSAEHHVEVDNTLEARLALARPYFQQHLPAWLGRAAET